MTVARWAWSSYFRSGVRVCGDPALAFPAGAFVGWRRGAGRVVDGGGVVGVDLHLVDHQLARSGKIADPSRAGWADDLRFAALVIDSQSLHRSRADVCRGVRVHAGRTHAVCDLGGAWRTAEHDPQLPTHPCMAGTVRGVLDRWRVCAR